MKIICHREKIIESLQIAQAALSPRATLPVLQNFLMEADSEVKLTCTDLEMAAVNNFKADIVEKGSVTVPGKELYEIIQSFNAGNEICVKSDTDNKITIESGKSRFVLSGTSRDDYPIIQGMDKDSTFEIPSAELALMIQKTIFSASTQESRYFLRGVLCIIGGGFMEMVATDGRRLALCKLSSPEYKNDCKAIIPTKILNEVSKLIAGNPGAAMKIGISANQIGFSLDGTVFLSRLVEGNFPNYGQVIPQKTEINFKCDAKNLLALTKRAALCTENRGLGVKYSVEGRTLKVSAVSQKMEFGEEMEIEYSGEKFEVAFNPPYAVDVLKNIGTKEISFGLNGPMNPVLIEPVGEKKCKYVIMPMRG